MLMSHEHKDQKMFLNFFSNKSTWSCSDRMINTKNHMYYANITWTHRPENVPNFFSSYKSTWSSSQQMINTKIHMYYANVTWS